MIKSQNSAAIKVFNCLKNFDFLKCHEAQPAAKDFYSDMKMCYYYLKIDITVYIIFKGSRQRFM